MLDRMYYRQWTLMAFKVKAVQSQASHSRVVTTNIKEYLPAHLRALFSAEEERGAPHRPPRR